ncbi:hypothetical protein [Aquabacterium sp.]|uniref:hypothetical protein n=1 Tax=Aquabacterium sp. TaxID=1872578 RepID=UPI0035B47D68
MTATPTSPPASPKRRWLLKTGLAIGAIGAALGGSIFWKRGVSDGHLTEHGREVFRGVARGVLANYLPDAPAAREALLSRHLKEMERFVQTLPHAVQIEFAALLGLMANAPTRMLVCGLRKSWSEASVEDIQAALETMRINKLPTNMMSYHALRDITGIVFFSTRDNWSLVGYPGPLDI